MIEWSFASSIDLNKYDRKEFGNKLINWSLYIAIIYIPFSTTCSPTNEYTFINYCNAVGGVACVRNTRVMCTREKVRNYSNLAAAWSV